ncbi:MAG: hypothetical protein IIA72_06420, partial [Proteobacteria bacterium]|nr:hypothetical protein [Pseudomonadota bacterium]
MPFAATRFPIPAAKLTGPTLGRTFREALDSWKPDAVFIGDGFFLKPFVIEALADYPLIGRYYAYEVPCMRDMLQFKNGAPCPKSYLTTPNVCRRCAVKGMGNGIRSWRIQSWTEEYLSAKAYLPGYHRRLTTALGQLNAIVVYNDLMRTQFEPFNDEIHVTSRGGELRLGEFQVVRSSHSIQQTSTRSGGSGKVQVVEMEAMVLLDTVDEKTIVSFHSRLKNHTYR